MFGYSDTWQLVINTGTTIITFLMVFLIQNTQNRDSEAIHVKLDEMIRALEGAHNALLDLEAVDDETLEKMRARYSEARQEGARGTSRRAARTSVARKSRSCWSRRRSKRHLATPRRKRAWKAE